MTQLGDLEEWKALQQIFPLVLSSAQYTRDELLGDNQIYRDTINHLSQEVQMINCSLDPWGPLLPQATVDRCRSELRRTLNVFESFVDTELLKDISPHPEKHRVVDTNEHTYSSSFSTDLFKHLPKLAIVCIRAAEGQPTFRFNTSTITDIQRVLESITKVNKLLDSINPTPAYLFTTPSTRKEPVEVDSSIRCFTENVLDKIQGLLSECEYGSTHHRMMVRFSGLQKLSRNVDLNLLLSSCASYANDGTFWQGVSCLYGLNTEDRSLDNQLNVVEGLCNMIQQSLHLNEHLRFYLLDDYLVSTGDSESLASYDSAKLGPSLYDLIKEDHFQKITWHSGDRFTIWEKRKLALDLALLFIHLYDCKWTQNRWEAANMHFLDPLATHQRENLLQIPPYLNCDSKTTSSTAGIEHLFCKGPLDFLTFGKLLLELEFGEEITATQCDRRGNHSLYLTLLVTLDQGRVSANRFYTEAIRGCLRLYKDPGSPDSLRKQIYNKIVSNLERELECLEKPSLPNAPVVQAGGRTQLPTSIKSGGSQTLSSCLLGHDETLAFRPAGHCESSEADQTASSSGLGRSIVSSATESSSSLAYRTQHNKDPQNSQSTHKYDICQHSKTGVLHSSREGLGTQGSSLSSTRRANNGVSKSQKAKFSWRKIKLRGASMFSALHEYKFGISNTVSLFDGSTDCLDPSQKSSAEEFFVSYNIFKRKMLQTSMYSEDGSLWNGDNPGTKFPKISVCVIDTGIDKNHPSFRGGLKRDSIRECRSWIGAPDDVHDEYGHGTHVVQLILDASENVDIYIAKVANGRDIERHDIGNLAAAIHYATAVWKVDIITMSFGFTEMNLSFEEAINEAASQGKLLFAAAANHGNNGVKTYPAKYRNVICINASDGKGKDGRISPAATDGADNFMTLGIAVPLSWKGVRVYKSGTSYATPIAVGFAINILEIVRRRLGQREFKRLKTGDDLMRRVFRMMSELDNRYYFIAPWRLWDSRAPELIDGLIKHELC